MDINGGVKVDATASPARRKKRSTLARLKKKHDAEAEADGSLDSLSQNEGTDEHVLRDTSPSPSVTLEEAEFPEVVHRRKKTKGTLLRLKQRQHDDHTSSNGDGVGDASSPSLPDDSAEVTEEITEEITEDLSSGFKAISVSETRTGPTSDASKPNVIVSSPNPSPSNQQSQPSFRRTPSDSGAESQPESDDDQELVQAEYQSLLSNRPIESPKPLPRTFVPIPQVSELAPMKSSAKARSNPDLSQSKRNWESVKSILGLYETSSDDGQPGSMVSVQSTGSGLHSIRMSQARHKNFLVGQQNSHSSMMGAGELDRIFPTRTMELFFGTWNIAEQKSMPRGLEDFLLPTSLETLPDMIVITMQENDVERKELEITLQEIIGPSHVMFHSVQLGALHMAVFMKRELIWFCSVAEDDGVLTRAFKQIRTKGAVAISFTLFGTSLLFIGCHFKALEGNNDARIADYKFINKNLKLPRAVVENPLQPHLPDADMRFDAVFWGGDMNFRIIKERETVLKMIDRAHKHQHPHFEQLLENDELTICMNSGEIFDGFQEGRISFPPTYKFDPGTDNYDTSPKYRIPSYTDRILFKSKKRHGVICMKYLSADAVQSSDHRPVYGLYHVNLKPGRDTIPLSGGQFKRDIYVSAAKRRAIRRVAATIKPQTGAAKSSICSVM